MPVSSAAPSWGQRLLVLSQSSQLCVAPMACGATGQENLAPMACFILWCPMILFVFSWENWKGKTVRKRAPGPEAIKGKAKQEKRQRVMQLEGGILLALSPWRDDMVALSLKLPLKTHICSICSSEKTVLCLSMGLSEATPKTFPRFPHLLCKLSVTIQHPRQSFFFSAWQLNTVPIQCGSLSRSFLSPGSLVSP